MPEPTTYSPSDDFTATDKGPQLNVELANVAEATGSIAAALAEIRRSDGALQNGIVTEDSLAAGLRDAIVNGAITQAAASATAADADATATAADRVQTGLDRLATGADAAAAAASAVAAAAAGTEIPVVATIAGLNAVATAETTVAYLADPVRSGIYRWNSAIPDFIHQGDTRQQKYIAPDAAAAGAWEAVDPPVKVRGADQIRGLLNTMRVDFCMVSDSNGGFSGEGWDEWLQAALSEQFPMYGTGLVTVWENNGSGSGTGYKYGRNMPTGTFTTDSPAELSRHLDASLNPHTRAYLADGATLTESSKGIALNADCPIDITGPLVATGWWGSFATGAGTFRLSARINESPFSVLASGVDVSTNTGVLGDMAAARLELAANAARTYPIGVNWGQASTATLTGPFFCTYLSVENTDRTTGFRFSKFRSFGGESVRAAASILEAADDDTLIHYFTAIRDGQRNQTRKAVVMVVNHGLNGRSSDEVNASVGPGTHLPGNDRFAQVDNFQAIRDRVEAIWLAQGWDIREVRWLYFVSHPVPEASNDAIMQTYDAQFATYFSLDPTRGQLVRLRELTTSEEMQANGWYATVADFNHLLNGEGNGYASLSRKIIDAMI